MVDLFKTKFHSKFNCIFLKIQIMKKSANKLNIKSNQFWEWSPRENKYGKTENT